jgi:hypothetical protein
VCAHMRARMTEWRTETKWLSHSGCVSDENVRNGCVHGVCIMNVTVCTCVEGFEYLCGI